MIGRETNIKKTEVKNTYKLTREQGILLIFASGYSNIVYTFTWVTKTTGKPFWIAVFIGVLMNIPFGLWIFKLGNRFQGYTIFDIIQSGLGKLITGFIAIVYIFINIMIGVCMLNMFVGSVKLYFLERTPSWFIMLILISLCILIVNSGVQNFSRLIELLAVLSVLNYFIAFSLSFTREFNIENITPLFDTTMHGFAEGVLLTAGGVAESLFFLMVIVGSVPEPRKRYIWVAKGYSYWAFILSMAGFIMAGDVSTEVLSRAGQAGMTVSRIIYLGGFIRGLELLVLMTYQYVAVVRTIMVLYSCWQSAKNLINIKRNWILLIVVSILLFVTSVWSNSFNISYFISLFIEYYVVLPFAIIVLLLASLSITLKNRKMRNA